MKLVSKIVRFLLLCSIFLFKQAPLHSMAGLKTGLSGLQLSMQKLKGELQKFSGKLQILQSDMGKVGGSGAKGQATSEKKVLAFFIDNEIDNDRVCAIFNEDAPYLLDKNQFSKDIAKLKKEAFFQEHLPGAIVNQNIEGESSDYYIFLSSVNLNKNLPSYHNYQSRSFNHIVDYELDKSVKDKCKELHQGLFNLSNTTDNEQDFTGYVLFGYWAKDNNLNIIYDSTTTLGFSKKLRASNQNTAKEACKKFAKEKAEEYGLKILQYRPMTLLHPYQIKNKSASLLDLGNPFIMACFVSIPGSLPKKALTQKEFTAFNGDSSIDYATRYYNYWLFTNPYYENEVINLAQPSVPQTQSPFSGASSIKKAFATLVGNIHNGNFGASEILKNTTTDPIQNASKQGRATGKWGDVLNRQYETIYFYDQNCRYYCFANFWRVYLPDHIEPTKMFITTEHFFQAQKFPHNQIIYKNFYSDANSVNSLYQGAAPSGALRYARQESGNIVQGWFDSQLNLLAMFKALQMKFNLKIYDEGGKKMIDNPFAKALIDTKSAILVEDTHTTPGDGYQEAFWGAVLFEGNTFDDTKVNLKNKPDVKRIYNGHNHLGRMLMYLRSFLLKSEDLSNATFDGYLAEFANSPEQLATLYKTGNPSVGPSAAGSASPFGHTPSASTGSSKKYVVLHQSTTGNKDWYVFNWNWNKPGSASLYIQYATTPSNSGFTPIPGTEKPFNGIANGIALKAGTVSGNFGQKWHKVSGIADPTVVAAKNALGIP